MKDPRPQICDLKKTGSPKEDANVIARDGGERPTNARNHGAKS